MRVLLILSHKSLSVTAQTVHTPPLGIGYIASFLLKNGHSVKIVDLQVQPEQMIFEDLAFDIIGISSLSTNFSKACELINAIKSDGRFTGKIILGGSHAAALPEKSLRESKADLVCIAEGERTMTELADNLPCEDISAIGWIENGRYMQNDYKKPAESLDDYPFPAFQLYNLRLYGSYNMVVVPPGTKDGIIITSRGCPFSCDFCSKIHQSIRYRSPDSIISEIIYLRDRFGYKKFSFIDDCFNADPKRAKEICRQIIQQKLEITFACPSGIRAELIDDELAGLMKKAGCIGANIGVESWDDEVRSKMNKRLKKEAVFNAVRLLRKHRMICTAYFMMGHYHDTTESLQRNISAIKELDADFFQFSKFIPMPGSAIFKRLEKEGRILEKDYSKFSIFGEANMIAHPRLSNDEIDLAIRTAYRTAAFRARTIITMIKHPVIILNVFRNMKQIKDITKLDFLSLLTDRQLGSIYRKFKNKRSLEKDKVSKVR